MQLTKSEKTKVLTDHLDNYDYLIEGRVPGIKGQYFDLDMFCYTLSACFAEDGVCRENLVPDSIYRLTMESLDRLCEIEEDGFTSAMAEDYIQYVEIPDWDDLHEDIKDIYSVNEMTQFHASFLAMPIFRHYWISCIGSVLVNQSTTPENVDPSSSNPVGYYDWILPEWEFVHRFISEFHIACSDWLRKFDKTVAQAGGTSLLETYAISKQSVEGYEEISTRLKKRNKTYSNLFEKIQSCINSTNYQTAINWQENLIVNCLKDYLSAKKIKPGGNFNSNLKKTINSIKKSKNTASADLFKKVDSWRKQRNDTVHNGLDTLLAGRDFSTQEDFVKNTAIEGFKLCYEVCDWYHEEATMYENLYRNVAEDVN